MTGMDLLVLNCGSATLKFDLFEAASGAEAGPALRRRASGQVERIGSRAALGPAAPMVAVFDTAFHAGLPPRAAHYALPGDLVARYGIRRFGFHGIAHAAMLREYAQLTGRPAASARLITFHLGNGCSA